MSEIKWRLEKRKISDLKKFDKNPRKISKYKMAKLQENIERFGFIDKPIINTDNTVLCGHQRIKALKASSLNEVDVWVPNTPLNEEMAKSLNVAHNVQYGEFDETMLAEEFDASQLADLGFSIEELSHFSIEEIDPDITEKDEGVKERKVTLTIPDEDYASFVTQLTVLLKAFPQVITKRC